MTMSVSVTNKRYSRYSKITFDCTTAADGTASGSTTDKVTGEIIRALIQPGSGGSQPTDLFDLTVTDADSHDVLLDYGANLSNADDTTIVASLGVVVNDPLTVNISNAGDTKDVDVVIYVMERE